MSERLSRKECLVLCFKKVKEVFEKNPDADTLDFANMWGVLDVADIIDWYRVIIGVPNFMEAADAMHEKMEEASLLSPDSRESFLEFAGYCEKEGKRKMALPDGTLPNFLWNEAGYDQTQYERDLEELRDAVGAKSIDLG